MATLPRQHHAGNDRWLEVRTTPGYVAATLLWTARRYVPSFQTQVDTMRTIMVMVNLLVMALVACQTNSLAEDRPPRVVGRYYDGESIIVAWETDPQAIRAMLPPPLQPLERPIVSATLTKWGEVDFIGDFTGGCTNYNLIVLAVPCRLGDKVGYYPATLLEDDDLPIYMGREMHGFPKKLGTLHLSRDGRSIHAWADRRGKRVFEVRADLTAELPQLRPVAERRARLTAEIQPDSKWTWGGFRVKALRKSGTAGLPPEEVFDFGPVLTEMAEISGPGFSRDGVQVECEVSEFELRHSPFDSAWSRFPVKNVVSVNYRVGNSFSMLSGRNRDDVKVDAAAFVELSKFHYDY